MGKEGKAREKNKSCLSIVPLRCQGKCPGSNWKYMSKPWERQMSWRDVGVRSVEKMVKVMEDLRQPNQK